MFSKYKKRLQTVRAELVAIEADSENLEVSDDDSETAKAVKAVGASIGRVCKILVRVIDSLPGE